MCLSIADPASNPTPVVVSVPFLVRRTRLGALQKLAMYRYQHWNEWTGTPANAIMRVGLRCGLSRHTIEAR